MASVRVRLQDDQQVADLLNKALQTRPAKQTQWSVRSFASEATISKDMAHRLFRATGIQQHRSTSFKLSNDPAFVEKVRDITGLDLNLADEALVLCVDEKSQIQALERTQPLLPMDWATSKASRTTMSATARRLCSQRSMSPSVKSFRVCVHCIRIRSNGPSAVTRSPASEN